MKTIIYEIYMHRFKTNGKIYIGQTSKGFLNRLKDHIYRALNGSTSNFHKAIRKYGIDDIETFLLDSADSLAESNRLETFYINKYDSFNTGYNMTIGGDVCKIKSDGVNNGRYSGFTDEQIINFAVQYFKDNNYILHRNGWERYSTKLGLPRNYSKFRFSGNGYQGFISSLRERLATLDIPYNDDSFSLTKSMRYPSKYSNLYGEKFGDYRVISDSFVFKSYGYSYVLCKCDCGKLKTWEACRFIKNKPKCNCKKEINVKNN